MNPEYILAHKASSSILCITIIMSIVCLEFNKRLFDDWKFSPYLFFNEKHYHTIITSGFIHVDYTHLIFNMMTFYFFAFNLESTIGLTKFLMLYISALVLSDIHVLLKHKHDRHYASVGASGAVTAVIFASVLYEPNMGIGLFFIPFYVPAPIFALLYIGLCIYLNKKDSVTNISHLAHLWGAIAGIVVMALLDPSAIRQFIETIDFAAWGNLN